VFCEKKKYFLLGQQEQPRQDKKLLYRHNKPNGPTKEGPLSYELLEFPFASVSTASRAKQHPTTKNRPGHLYIFLFP
jgi:hypothetical protein